MDESLLSDSEIALVDALKTVLEVLILADVARANLFASMFAYQRDGYIKKQLPKAAAVMELLIQFLADKEREKYRESRRLIRDESPKGSA